MIGALSEFTLGQLLQLFSLAEKSGTITVHSASIHTRLLIESDRVVGLGAPDFDVRADALRIALLPHRTRNALNEIIYRPDTPGLSLIVGNLLSPRRWEQYLARQFEQQVYPMLNEDDGAFEITVERCPPAPLRVSVTVQQLILDSSRWEAESERLRADGYHLDGTWRRIEPPTDVEVQELGQPGWMLWHIMRERMTIADAAQRLAIPDLTAATAVRRLHAAGLLTRAR